MTVCESNIILFNAIVVGTHDELLASALRGEGAGIYANLWNMQLQHRDRGSLTTLSPTDMNIVEGDNEQSVV